MSQVSVTLTLAVKTFEEIEKKLEEAKKFQEEGADLVCIDGISFTLACTSFKTENELLNIIQKSKSVIFGRLSPFQKA